MEDIDKLLGKYFEGETSLHEESVLRDYFRRANIEERHTMYAPMFNFFSSERKEVVVEKKKKPPVFVWFGVAASILLIICVRFFYQTPVDRDAARTFVYIDGKKITNEQMMNVATLNSIQDISEIDGEIIDSQIGILDSFTE